ncbi:sigma-70 family RNA polymerase sigma factor [Altererythrobacter xixiisoli]|uniref:Sigma-70 family RNA polymerase sigma factor n=1 Tax=Croceibacterium xixiisoli TaxID=1476466 RepID=A0A6I4TQ28_9SPHN|nr:sigma-70 family RNA polymerase sigma factor [Croceibacterium xixiisoli]MXO97974.1 sigma-70 family RNA polymerase sigma factor [Croceibacterium xixiisoli]
MTPELPDDELMARIARGDVFAYTALVQRHLPRVYRTAHRMLHDPSEAEDVAQDSFARLWQNAPRWNGGGAGVAAWLRRVCANLCFDRLRQRGRWSSDEAPDLADPAAGADRTAAQAEIADMIEVGLRALSDAHRAAIVLTYYEEYSNRMAAEILQLDIKAFESLLFRARKKLAVLLTQGGVLAQDLELFA